MIVEVEPAGEGDLRTGRQHDLGLGPALGGEEVAAVDHRGGQGAVVDHRAGARTPVRSGVAREVLGGLVAEELEGVAPLDQRHALGGEALQLDGADLGAVLFALAAPLRLLVVVELALDPVVGAVEEVDGRPEQVFEVGFEAGVGQAWRRGRRRCRRRRPRRVCASGSGRGSGSSWKGR